MKRKSFLALFFVIIMTFSFIPAQAQQDFPLLSVKSSGDEVIKLQQRLIQAGFLIGQADGIYGEATRKAVVSFQQAMASQGHQLKADGIAGPATLSLLYDDGVMRPFIDFSLGTTGQRVIALQNRLIDLKFMAGPADGVFGQKTLEALQAFQSHLIANGAQDLMVTGSMDKATRDWLDPKADLSGFSIRAPEFFDDANPLELRDEYLNAKACILVRADTGEILYAKNPDERMFPASTTKIMTLLLAVERGGLEDRVTVPSSALKVPADSSLVPVYPGEKMLLRDLLHGLMLRSGNDAANAVAEICAGSVEEFVSRMNLKAEQMGLSGTQFTNPHGYHDPEHYTTARDLVTLAVYAMQNPQAAEIACALEYQMAATSKRGALTLYSGSELLNASSPFYYKDAYGIKSGYTSAAGFCYVGMARRGDRMLYAVIMASRTRNRGWNDMARLFNFGFARMGY